MRGSTPAAPGILEGVGTLDRRSTGLLREPGLRSVHLDSIAEDAGVPERCKMDFCSIPLFSAPAVFLGSVEIVGGTEERCNTVLRLPEPASASGMSERIEVADLTPGVNAGERSGETGTLSTFPFAGVR